MMYLNTAVAREVRAELERQEMKPKALTFWLGVGDKKASALYKGESVWTMPNSKRSPRGWMSISLRW